jgi:hypothetical protein
MDTKLTYQLAQTEQLKPSSGATVVRCLSKTAVTVSRAKAAGR